MNSIQSVVFFNGSEEDMNGAISTKNEDGWTLVNVVPRDTEDFILIFTKITVPVAP